KRLALFSIGTECAIVVSDGANGKFDEPADAIEFYGLPLDTASTGARTYWLTAGKGRGDRVGSAKGKGGDPFAGSTSFAYERKERSVYFPTPTTNPDDQNFYGPVVTSSATTEELTLGNVDTSASGNASLTVALQGGTDFPIHRVEVTINGHAVGIAT